MGGDATMPGTEKETVPRPSSIVLSEAFYVLGPNALSSEAAGPR